MVQSERERERERKREGNLKEISLFQKLFDSLDLRERVNKCDTNLIL